MSNLKWAMEGVAYGPNKQQAVVQLGFDTEPTTQNIEQARVDMSKGLWALFTAAFHCDPTRVEVYDPEPTPPDTSNPAAEDAAMREAENDLDFADPPTPDD